jgi:hypothetical protein
MNLAEIVLNAFKALPDGIGGTVTCTRTVPGTYTPGTGERTADTIQSFTTECALVPPKTEWADGAARRPAYEAVLLVPAQLATFRPVVDDYVTVNGAKWRIVAVDVLDPTGTQNVLYTFGVSR